MTDYDAPTPTNIAWAAGLFEGEGSIVSRRGGKGVLLTLAMTDRDIVERYRSIIEGGAVYPLKRPNGWKQAWRCDVVKAEDVIRVTAMLRPYFGERRAAKADELVGGLIREIQAVTRSRACKACGAVFVPAYGPNAERREFCDWRCSNHWHGSRRADRNPLVAKSQLEIGS